MPKNYRGDDNIRTKKANKKIVITNKFSETSNIDIKSQIENAFKIFYKIQINKKQGK